MKKIVIASMLAMSAMVVSAAEFGLTGTRDYSGDQRTAYGLTVGEKFGSVNVTGGFERATTSPETQDRVSVVAGYDLVKVGSVTFSANVGAAYLNNDVSADGYAVTVGAGAQMPITKTVAVAVGIARQYGQERVNQFDGNRVTVGLKYKF